MIELEKRAPITYKDLEEVKRQLTQQEYTGDKTVKWDWCIPEGQYFENTEKNFFVMHPHDVASLIQRTLGSDEALNFIRKRLHERITNMFRRHWEMDIYKSTGYLMKYAPENTKREEILVFSNRQSPFPPVEGFLGVASRDADGKFTYYGIKPFIYQRANPGFYNVFHLGGDQS